MYLPGTGQTAPSLKESSAGLVWFSADASLRDGAVCPVPCRYICSHFEKIPKKWRFLLITPRWIGSKSCFSDSWWTCKSRVVGSSFLLVGRSSRSSSAPLRNITHRWRHSDRSTAPPTSLFSPHITSPSPFRCNLVISVIMIPFSISAVEVVSANVCRARDLNESK